jgi:hypothetical protein
MFMRTTYGIITGALLFAAACTGAGETAVVTQRPTTRTDTVAVEPAPPMPDDNVSVADTVTVGRFDTGKMWTFDNPPVEYFAEAYNFSPDTSWFGRASRGALRFSTYCSASFVSPFGLVMTNHHCARESVTEVTRSGEELIDNGFYARSLEEERQVPDLYVDQLVEIADVTDEVEGAVGNIRDDTRRAEVLAETISGIEEDMTADARRADTSLVVEVVELYNGGRYSAYTFRRYRDVRLVMAPQHAVAAFGGDPDNFTYPRYSLDMSFFRVYGPDGEPLQSQTYFPFSENGSDVGEVVFVVGNPGSTSRLSAVSQLVFERQYNLPQQLALLRARAAILAPYIEANPEEAEETGLRNDYYSLTNSIKALQGELEGLQDPQLIARRQAAEDQLQQAILANDTLRSRYGNVLQQLEQLQRSKQATAVQAGAFTYFGAESMESHVLLRALYGWLYDFVRQRGAPPEQYEEYREGGLEVEDWPVEVEQAFLAARLREIQRYFGETDFVVRRILNGRTPEQVAADIVANTALVDSAGFARLLDEGYLESGDPTVTLIETIAPLYFQFSDQLSNLEAREQNLTAQLARARFDIYGMDIPPDASFSLRIADGVVRGYPYNGTLAPPYTTMWGLYDHHYSYSEEWEDFKLPDNWLTPPAGFDRSTPINMVSTNDITGGNSGSPLLNRDLEVVGLIFDSNIEALPNVYLYTDEPGRAISVDSRGILETLDDIYDADRVALELRDQRLARTEEEADAMAAVP